MKRSVSVTIAGQKYVLKSDADEAYVHALAAQVDDKMRQLARGTKQVATHQLAILAALQIADDLERERRGRAELRKRVREQGRRMLAVIARESKL